jgi:polysaccharide pyruvyl transferase WcaK-like protein
MDAMQDLILSDSHNGANRRRGFKMRAEAAVNKFCIVNFTGFRGNWGCQATSWELLKFINGCFGDRKLPQVSFVPQLPHCDVDLRLAKCVTQIYSAVRSVTDGLPDAQAKLRYLEQLCTERYGFWLDEVRSADIIFFQGEGTMSGCVNFSEGVGLFLLPFVAKHAWGKPVISLNQTIFGRDPELLAAVARMLNSFDFTAVREGASAEFAKSLGIVPCHYIPDAAFLTKPSPDPLLPTLKPSQRYFCVTGSASAESEARDIIFGLADRVRVETGLTPIVAISKDTRIRELARSHWPSGTYEVVDQAVHYPAVAHVLQHCEFVLGGRYHMAIMAAAVGTPSILLRGNTFKNEGLAAMIRAPFPVRTFHQSTEIMADVHALLSDLKSARRQLNDAAALIHTCLREAQSLLVDVMSGRTSGRNISTRPPTIKVSDDSTDYYVDVALRGIDKIEKKGVTKSALKKRLGSRRSLRELLVPLLSGLQGDPIATRLALNQILDSHPTLRARALILAALENSGLRRIRRGLAASGTKR